MTSIAMPLESSSVPDHSHPSCLVSTGRALLNDEILLQTRSHTAWGGAVTAQMHLSMPRSQVWKQITDYPRWVSYFPDLTQSRILSATDEPIRGGKQLYQAARKAFLMLTAEVEVYLRVFEVTRNTTQQSIQFCMEKGSFSDFFAELKLQDCEAGTLLTYSVQATPLIPVPSFLIQQAMRADLPSNLKTMREVLYKG